MKLLSGKENTNFVYNVNKKDIIICECVAKNKIRVSNAKEVMK